MTRPAPCTNKCSFLPAPGPAAPAPPQIGNSGPGSASRPSTGRRTPAGPAATGPAKAPPAGQEQRQRPRNARSRSHAGTPDAKTGPSSATAREKPQHAQPKPESPRTHGTPERLTAGQDAPRNDPRTGGPRSRNAYILLYIKHQQITQIYSYIFVHYSIFTIYLYRYIMEPSKETKTETEPAPQRRRKDKKK